MSAKPDHGLRALFGQRLPQVHWQTIETGLVARGVPDSNGCHSGVEFWIEHKWTEHWAVDLAPEQVAWLTRRYRAGGRVFVAVRRRYLQTTRRRRSADGGLETSCDELWLLKGEFAREIKDEGLKCTPKAILGIWSKGPARWDWDEALWLLTRSGVGGNRLSSSEGPPLTISVKSGSLPKI